MAIVRRGGTIQSEKFLRKRRKKLLIAAVLFVVAAAAVVTTVYFFFAAPFVQIKSVTVSGPIGINNGMLSIVSAPAVQTDVQNALSGKWLGLISKNTIFTYPDDTIRAELLQKYPAAKTVDFGSEGSFLGFGNSLGLHVYITERSPFALACSNTAVKGKTAQCYYLDDSGFAYAPVLTGQSASSSAFIRYSLLQSGIASGTPELAAGVQFISPDTFASAKEIVGVLSGLGLDVVADDIGQDAYGSENDIVIGTTPTSAMTAATPAATTTAAMTTTIYFNQSEPVDTELRYFDEFWRSEATSTATQFQYIDMRYGKDIVYKMYDQGAATSAASAAQSVDKH